MYRKFRGVKIMPALICGGMTLVANAAEHPVQKIQINLTTEQMNSHNVSGNMFTCPSAEEVSVARLKGNKHVGFEKNGVLFKGIVESPNLEESAITWIKLDPADKHISGIKCSYEYSDGRESAAHVDVDFKGMGLDPKSVTFIGRNERKIGSSLIMSGNNTKFTINLK